MWPYDDLPPESPQPNPKAFTDRNLSKYAEYIDPRTGLPKKPAKSTPPPPPPTPPLPPEYVAPVHRFVPNKDTFEQRVSAFFAALRSLGGRASAGQLTRLMYVDVPGTPAYREVHTNIAATAKLLVARGSVGVERDEVNGETVELYFVRPEFTKMEIQELLKFNITKVVRKVMGHRETRPHAKILADRKLIIDIVKSRPGPWSSLQVIQAFCIARGLEPPFNHSSGNTRLNSVIERDLNYTSKGTSFGLIQFGNPKAYRRLEDGEIKI